MESEANVMEEETAEVYVKAGTNYVDEDGEKQRVEAGVSFSPGEDLTDATELYGEEVVYQRYLRGVTKDLGNAIRSGLNKFLALEGEDAVDPEEIPALVVAELANWRPDVTRRPARKENAESILANFASLSPEKQQEVLAALQAKAAG